MVVRPLDPEADRSAVDALLEACEASDGFVPLSEAKRTAFDRDEGLPAVVAESNGDVVALAQTATHHGPSGAPSALWEAEIAVHPDHRVEEMLGRMVDAVRTITPSAVDLWTMSDWAAGIVGAGYEEIRTLHLMERPLPTPDPRFDAGVSVRSLEPGEEKAWLEVNNEAFAGHPEQGDWTEEDLSRRFSLPWFDRSHVLMAWEGRRALGFCWTKLHRRYRPSVSGSGAGRAGRQFPEVTAGEIYVIGVHPGAQGRGLGRDLTLAGLRHLHDTHHAETGILWVEADNGPGMTMYRKLGFEVARTIRAFRLSEES